MNFFDYFFGQVSERSHCMGASTEMPRLTNMRIHRLNTVSCGREDLISSLHANSSSLNHAHDIELSGLKYWLHNSDVYPGRLAALDDTGFGYCEQNHAKKSNLGGGNRASAQRRQIDFAAVPNSDNDDSWKQHFIESKLACMKLALQEGDLNASDGK